MKPLDELSLGEVQVLDPETRARWEREVEQPLVAQFLERTEPAWRRFRERLMRWYEVPADGDSGDLIDLDIMALVFRGGDEELRLRAARRVADQLDLRIHSGRGVRFENRAERMHLILAALFEVVEDGTPGPARRPRCCGVWSPGGPSACGSRGA